MASRPIDEKIVVMKLDNSDFAQKATETTSIFGKLRESINRVPGVNLGKTATELGNIQTEASRPNLQRLSETVQMISSRFSALGIMGVTALQNITNRAVDAGIALGKSLSFDQITAGFAEYELKMGSIQTILANTQKHGTNLDDVSKSLNQLNDYADQTIYNFGDMTKNIGLFTNAGLKLEESVSMIKGFSNAAAASGTDAQGAAHAAYQLSQALSAGTIRLMDWRSLTNVGMGNKNMQEGLVTLATAMGEFAGTGIDGKVVLEDFNGSLEKNWLSADVMSKYLQIMAKDMDATEMATLGLTDAQIKLFEQQSTTAMEAATKVRTFTGLMEGLKEAIGSSWATTFEQIFGDFDEATALWTRLSDAVNGFFTSSGNKRNEFLKGIADKGGFLNIFDGITNSLKPVMQVFDAISDGFSKAFPPRTVDQVVKMTASFKEFTKGLSLNEYTVGKLTTVFQGAFSIFSTVIEIAKQLGSAFLNLIPPGAGGGILSFLENIALMAIAFNKSVKEGNFLTTTIEGLGKVFGTIGGILGSAISAVGSFTGSLTDGLGKAIDWIADKLAPLGQIFKETFSGFGGDDALGAGTLVAMALLIKKALGFETGIGGLFEDLKETIGNAGDLFENLGESLQAFTTGLKIANLVLIAGALTLIAVSLKMLEGIKTEDMTKGITALAVSLGVMLGAVAIISKFDITGGMGAAMTILALAAATTVMASALKKISDLNPDELKVGLAGLVGIVATLVVAMTTLSKLGGKIATSSLQLMALSTAVYILAGAVNKMAEIDGGSLSKSVITLGIIFAELALFLKVANGSKLGPGSAIGLLATAGAIQMMVSAISQISGIDTVSLIAGLTTIGIILAEVALFSLVAGGPNMILAGTGILLIAGAINALVPPIQALGSMSLEELAKGLGSMAIALAAVAAAGLLASGAIGGAIAITIMAAALNNLVGPIQTLSQMTWGELLKGVGGLALGLGLLAGAAILLSPAVGPMLAFGAALLVIGTAIVAAGAGIALFGTGLATLATMTAASVAAIVSALALLLKGFTELIPAAVRFVVDLGVALVDGIRTLVPKIVETVVHLIVSLLQVIADHLPRFLELGVQIIVQLIEGIGSHAPTLISACLQLIVDIVNGMADAVETYGPQLISAFWNLFGEIILLIVEAGAQAVTAMFGWIPGVQGAAAEIGSTAEAYIRENFGAAEVGTQKGQEFVNSLNQAKDGAKTSGITIGTAVKEGVTSVDLRTAGMLAGRDFAAGINDSAPSVRLSATSLASTADVAIKQRMGIQSPAKETIKSGKHTGDGFAKGISSKKKAVKKSANSVADAAKKAFNKKMDEAEYKFKMGEINSTQYIAEIEKIKKSYSKYPELVRTANLEIKKIEDKASKDKQKATKDDFNKAKQAIDDKKYYNQISLEEELKAWEAIQSKYKKGTDERKQADREVYRLKNELVKEEFNNFKASIDSRKQLNTISLAEELKSWEDATKKYKKGTDERAEAEREVGRVKVEIHSKLMSLNDEYTAKIKETTQKLIDGEKAYNDEFNSAWESKRQSLVSFAGLFDEVTAKSDISGQQLIDNLKSQVSTFAEWSANIKSLATKGIDEGLLKELQDMGPKAASEIAALNTLTESQLTEYTALWKTKNEQARVQATQELEGLRVETDAKIATLRKETETNLEAYKTEWVKKIQEIRTGTVQEFNAMNASMNSIGQDTIRGLMVGMETMRGEALAMAQSIAAEITATISAALQINSPSKVTTKQGEFVGAGLVVGMANSIKSVRKGATNLAGSVKDSIDEFMDGFNAPELDNVLHIQAILDLDKSSMDGIGNVRIQPDTSFTNSTLQASEAIRNRQNDNNLPTKVDKINSEPRPVHIEQTLSFHSRELTPSEVARKNIQASRDLAKQWG